MLLYAFIGGIILNVMPCVLPVIALKILGFVSEARSNPGHVRKLGLIYALGVLVSFLALAGLVIAVQAAGKLAGWGMQFSNPYFLVTMSILVVLITLNLFGVFEVSLSGRTMDAASALTTRHGPTGAFFNGLLATVLATACTAPVLGTAVGYAFAQPPLTIVLIFLTVGVGLAFPYVVLSWKPAWLKFLPKPGAWMEKFKVAMGFAMLAASVWLLSLVTIFYGERTWWLAMFLVVLALAAWVFGEFVQRGRKQRGVAFVTVAVLVGAGYLFTFERQFEWRAPITASAAAAAAGNSDQALPANLVPAGYNWEPWSWNSISSAERKKPKC
jgi:thiol:disulfide interchange protein DsbD